MADTNRDYYSEIMFYDENIYKPEVRLDEDGVYRWRYQLDPYHERKMYLLLVKIFGFISPAGAVLGFLLAKVPPDKLRENPAAYHSMLLKQQLLYAVLGFAVFFIFGLLVIGLIRLVEGGSTNYWYQMDDELVHLEPSGRGSGIHTFAEVKRVELYPEVNEIRMVSRWGRCPVLVGTEDYELVKKHILEHIPENTEIINK